MDVFKGLGLSGKQYCNTERSRASGNDPRRLLRERSGQSRRAGVFQSASICCAYNKDDAPGISAGEKRFVVSGSCRIEFQLAHPGKGDLQSPSVVLQ